MLKERKNVNKIRKILVALMVIIMTLGIYINVEAVDTDLNLNSQGTTINPIYRPEWEKVSSTISIDEDNLADSTISIVLRGTASKTEGDKTGGTDTTNIYSSTVTSDLQPEDITVYINNTQADITKVITPPADTTDVESATYTLTLSGFEKHERESGVPYKDWSGNIKIRIGGRGEAPETYTADVLLDKYGNQNMMAIDTTGTWIDVTYKDTDTNKITDNTMFVDFVEPEFTYESSKTTIVGGNIEKVTVLFDVTDQYFKTSLMTADFITVKVGEQEVNSTVNVTKTLTKIKNVYYDATAGTNYVELDATGVETGTGIGTKVGETYQLEITGLDQGQGFDYSGNMTLTVPAGTKDGSGNLISGAIDNSGNLNIATTITIGLDDKDGNPGADSAGSGTIVDVVDPIWKVENIQINENLENLKNSTVVLELSATDKYYYSNIFEEARTAGTLDAALRENILLYIDGQLDGDTDGDGILETGETPTITKTLSTATNLTPTGTGVKYTLTFSNWDAERYSGTAKFIIPKDTITDQTVDGRYNTSNQQEFVIGHIDFTKPVITKVSSDNIDTNSDGVDDSVQIVFKALDKFMVMSDLVTIPDATNPTAPDEITVYVDNEVTTGITRTLTSEEITEVVNGVTVKGHQYTLVLSNFEQTRTTINRAREFSDWSGTVRIDIKQGAVRDEEVTNANGEVAGGNVNDLTPIVGEFADFIKPNVTYEYSNTDIVRNHENKTLRTFTMKFDVTDKYFTSSAFATALELATTDAQKLAVLQEYLTIWVDGVDVTNVATVTKKIVGIENVTATMNKTTDIVNKTITNNVSNAVIGKRFTLEISNLEQDVTTAIGNDFLNYSGVITVGFNTGKPLATDYTGNSNLAGTIAAPSITSGVTTPDGSGSSVIVDLVDPLWEQADTATVEVYNGYAEIPIKGTDKYIQTNNLQLSDITITVSTPYGTTVANGANANGTTDLDTSEDVEQKLKLTITQDTSVTLEYGKQYIVKLEGYSPDAYQVKLTLRDGILSDTSGNTSQETTFILFTSLANTSTETLPTSEFLAQNKAEGQTIPQRQYVEQVIFQNDLTGMNETKWDVSQLNDGTIWAWYTTREVSGTTLYTVYIGSYIIMNANVDSSYLFANLGYDTNCKVTGDTTDNELLENLYILQVSNVQNMSHMFEKSGYANMKSLDLGSAFNTISVTDMSYMFQNCGNTAMTSLDLGEKFDTSKVTNMSYMFNGCGQDVMTTLTIDTDINTINFDTSKVTNMSAMFQNFGAGKLTTLTLGDNFNTSAVTDMSNMFNGCGKSEMTTISLGNNFNTAKVQYMNGMFKDFGQTKQTTLDLGDLFYTTSATDMSNMFNGCGTTAMTILDMGPAFTKIADTNTDFITNCGNSSTVIYAPESIYSSMKNFKLNTTSSTKITLNSSIQGTINPVYRPEWIKVSSSLNTSTGVMTIKVKGVANKTFTNGSYTGTYTSNVTSEVASNNITVYVDGELATGIDASDITVSTATSSTNATTGKTEVQYTITISNFEQSTRLGAKNFKEWSGNVSLQFDKGTLIDMYGSQFDGEGNFQNIAGNSNLAIIDIDTAGTTEKIVVEETTKLTANTAQPATDAKMFTDLIKPEFTYESSNTSIGDGNHGDTKIVTVVFDVTDKYFDSTDLATDTNANLIKVLVDGELPGDTNGDGIIGEGETLAISKVLSKTGIFVMNTETNTITLQSTDYTLQANERKTGERYSLVVTQLDKLEGFDFSGPMTLTFGNGIVTDLSTNENVATTITIGLDDKDGATGPDTAGDGTIVDVVDPVWKAQNLTTTTTDGITTATVDLIATDKYFKQSTLEKDDVQVIVAGVDIAETDAEGNSTIAPELVTTLSDPQYILWNHDTQTYTTATEATANGVKYSYSVTNLEETYETYIGERAKYITDSTTGRVYREYSGPVQIMVPADTIEDNSGNKNLDFTIDVGTLDTLKPEVVKVSDTTNINATNVELSTYTVVFDITDKYMNSSAITTTDTSMIHVYLDGEEAASITKPTTAEEQTANSDKIFKEITNIETLRADVNADGTVASTEIVGYRYTLVLSGFEKPRTSINYDREYTDWSGDISIKIDAETATDQNGLKNDETMLYGNEANTELKGTEDHVDFVKPDATYEFSSVQDGVSDVVDKNGKTYEMTFDITDKFFLTEDTNANGTLDEGEDKDNDGVLDDGNGLSISDFTIQMSAENETGEGEDGYYDIVDIMSKTNIDKALEKVDITNEVVVDVVNGTEVKETRVIGKRYTLRLSNLEQLQRIEGNKYLDYSGSITITIPAGKVTDTSGNGNDMTVITSGIDIPGGEVTDIEAIDVVQPLWERTAFTTDIHAKTASITLLGTDKYFYEYDLEPGDEGYDEDLANNGTLKLEEIGLYINGIATTGKISGDVKTLVDGDGNVIGKLTIASEEKLSEERLVQTEYSDGDVDTGYTTETVQYGVRYVLNITDLAIDAEQIKIHLPEGSLVDKSENPNRVTEFLVYNTLRKAMNSAETAWEDSETSGFLGNANISRQNIQKVEFVSNLNNAPTIDGTTCWDVSSVKDNSILAWYEEESAPYTVYIGSNDNIYGNIDSRYLFSYIGYGTNCTATDTISGITLLDTRNVTDMSYMFNYCGYRNMSSLQLGANFDTSRVTNMSNMFNSCGYKTMSTFSFGSKFDTSKVTNMSSMFQGFAQESTGFTTLDLGASGVTFKTNEVTDMSNMFNGSGQTALTTFSLGTNFNTSKVDNMSGMFQNFAYKLVTLDLGGNFHTTLVTNMSNMFNGCGQTSMTTLNLGDNFDTSTVQNMSGMFQDFAKSSTTMTSLDLNDKFYTTVVTDMSNMFNGCGQTSMTTLDLGPAFTKIASTNTGFVTNCGKSGAIIFAPESIYNDRTHFKLNTDSTTTIQYTRGTINPVYRPKWEKVSSTLVDSTIEIVIKGNVDSTAYATATKTITSSVTAGNDLSNLLIVKVDGEVAEEITQTVTVVSETATEVQYKITLSNFKEDIRQVAKNKNFLEWAGNIAVQPIKGTLIDAYGNKNMISIDDSNGNWLDIEIRDAAQDGATGNWIDDTTTTTVEELEDNNTDASTNGIMFTDYIIPEFTYEYHNESVDTNANTVIDYENNKVTIVFDVTDKYFQDAIFTKDDITVSLLNDDTLLPETSDINTVIQKNLALKTIAKEYKVGDLTYKTDGSIYYPINGVDTKVGERYELVITNLETANGIGYSGPMSLTFPAGVKDASGNLTKGIMDKSGNLNVSTTITIGIDEPDNHEEHDSAVVVDVVNPRWVGLRNQNSIDRATDKVNIQILGIDKYYKTNTFAEAIASGNTTTINTALEKITVYVDLDGDGTAEDTETVTTVRKSITAMDATEVATLAAGAGLTDVKVGYTLTLSNFGTTPENISGITRITIADGTIEDNSGNVNEDTDTIFAGNIEWVETNEPLVEGATGYPRYPAFRQDIVDFIDPVIRYQYSAVENAENPDIDYGGKKVTIKFTLLEKYLKETTLINADGTLNTDAVQIYIDVNGTFTDVTSDVTTDITQQEITNGIEYTLEVSGLEQNPYYDASSYSGPMQLVFTAGTIDDTSGNKNALTTITIDTDDGNDSSDGVIVDVVDPIVKITEDTNPLSYRNAFNSINRENDLDTVVVRIRLEDKYLNKESGNLIANKANIKVKVQKPNGTVVEDATKVVNPVTVDVVEKSITDADKFEYEITLGNFTSNEGLTSIIIPEDTIKDIFGNGNKETEVFVGRVDWTGDGSYTAFNNSIVDFTDPTWTKVTSSITRNRDGEIGTVTLKLLGYDIYKKEDTLDEDLITVSINGTPNGDISKLLEPITDTTELTNLAAQAGLDVTGRTITDVVTGHTLTLGNFGTNEGTVTIKIADGTLKDTSGNGNITDIINVGNVQWLETDVDVEDDDEDETPAIDENNSITDVKYTAFRSGIVDFIKPVIKYQYQENVNPKLNRTDGNETVDIIFTATDTNFLESNIGLDDMLIYVDDMLVYGTGANDETKISAALVSEAITDGSANGMKYTLTLSALELNTLLGTEIYERHSGVIKIVIAGEQVEDTSGNKSRETTIIVDNDNGDDVNNGVIVDFINPIIYYKDKYIDWEDRYALITVRATDRFYDTTTKLQPSDLTLYEQNSAGNYIQITSIPQDDITITPISNGYGYDFVIRIDNFEQEFRMKIAIAGGKLKDSSNNSNDPTDIFVDLDNRRPTWEYVSTDSSGFEPETGGTISFNVKGVDKFLDLTNSNLEVGDITVLLDGVDITSNEGIGVQVTHVEPDDTDNSDDGERAESYKIDVTGLTTVGTYTLVLAEGTLIDDFDNESAATTISFSKSIIAPNTANYTNITYHVTPDQETVHSSYVHELMSVNTTGTNSNPENMSATYRPSTLGELHNGGENPLFAEPMYDPVVTGYTLSYVYSPKSFAGWAEADSDGNIIYYTDSTLTTVSATKTTYTKQFGLYDEIPKTITNLKAVWQDATVVFVSNTDGDNTNDGTLPEKAVKDLATAYTKLDASGNATNNIIVIMDAIEWNSGSTLSGNATITSLYAGVDYSLQGAELKISSNMIIDGDIIFDNIELYSDSNTVSAGTDYLGNGTYTNMLISNYSGDITIGRGVETPSGKYTFGAVVGGNYKTETSTGELGEHTIRIEAGTYNNIIAGSSVTTPTTANKFIYHNVVIGNMRDTSISTNSKLTITGYLAIGENELKSYPKGASGPSDSHNKNYADVTLYSGTFTGVNKFAKASENSAIYLRSINGQTDGKITFTMYGGVVNNNIYGGARVSGSYSTTVVNTMKFYGGQLTGNIFGQSANDTFTGSSDITLQGIFTMTGDVFGGSNSGASQGDGTGNTNITINSASTTVNGNIYGGSNGVSNSGYLNGKTVITLKLGTVKNIYGSGKNSGNSNTTTITVENGLVSENIVGGAYNGQSGSSTITVVGGTVTGNIFGGNENTAQSYMDSDTTTQDVSITIGDTTVATTPTVNGIIYGSGKFDKVDEVTIQLIKCTNTTSVYGGSNANAETTKANIYLNGMTVNAIYGGGQSAGTVGTANIYLQSGTATNVYGGGYNADVTTSKIYLEGTATVTNIFGGSSTGGTVETSNVTLTSGNLTDVYGGGNSAAVGTANVTLNGITIGSIHGGSKDAGVTTTTNVTLTSGTVTDVFGGGLDVGVTTSNIIHENGATVTNIYGGNDTESGTGGDTGTSNINILNSSVTNVYGGNYLKGTTRYTNINIEGTSTITGKLFGGGYKSEIGKTGENGSTKINISGGTISTDVNGGSEESTVYGTTNINIGKDATDTVDSTLVAGNINIQGTIYGAGSSASNGYEDISVQGNTHILMDNSTTYPITYSGSIFGSGKGATYSTSGNDTDLSTIKLIDFGTSHTNTYAFDSIERTGTLYIGNSFIEFFGRQDPYNAYSKTSYSLNRITKGLTIYNNTTIYNRRGYNMVGGFKSLATLNANGTGTQATATISGTEVTTNTDNRLYTLEGINLIFAKREGNIYADITQDIWGDVYGMTFFGMYTLDRSTNAKVYDIYEPNYDGGAVEDFYSNGTYVEGRHRLNQNKSVDGFYTNVATYGGTITVTPQYIDVVDYGTYYDWIIGAEVINHETRLIASTYGYESVAELLIDYEYAKGATYTLDNASLNALNTNVTLINSSTVPTISNNANNTFGLTMETSKSGWLNSAVSNIYTASGGSFDGDTSYKSDDTTTAGTLVFKIHNSLNITEQKDLGNVNLRLIGKTPTNSDGTGGNVFIVNIAVNIQTVVDVQKQGYVPSFTDSIATEQSYTTDSRVDLSYILYNAVDSTPYANDDYRVISSTVQLPAGTRLKLKDYGQGDSVNKVYYYHVTSNTDYDGTDTVNGVTRYLYNLADFIEIGDTNTTYANNNSTYYHTGTTPYVLEKYDLSIDFIDSNIAQTLKNEIYLELRNSSGTVKYDNANTAIKYNLYSNKNAVVTETISNEGQSYSVVENLTIPFTLDASILEQSGIMDTKYHGRISGLAIEIVNAQGVKVTSPDVQNFKLVDNDTSTTYSADHLGVIRVPLMEGLSTVAKDYKLLVTQSNVTPALYTVKVHLLTSADGQYYGNKQNIYDGEQYYPNVQSIHKDFYITFISKLHGLAGVEATPDSRIVNETTRVNLEGNNGIDMTINIANPTSSTNMRVELYKRNPTYTVSDDGLTTTYNGTSYTLVDITQYLEPFAVETLEEGEEAVWKKPSDYGLTNANANEYMVSLKKTYAEIPEFETIQFETALKEGIATGEYKLEFKTYHEDTLVQTIKKTFLVTP